jgi:hypothetical protein
MRTPVFVALEGPEFAGIQTNTNYPRVISEVLATTRPMVRLTLGNRESLMFAVPATADMRALMTARRVIKLTPPGEYASEWLVSRVVEILAPGNAPALAVECDPIWAIMGDVGIIEQVFEGGQSFANLGGINGTAANYLATYVIPALQRRNVSWIELGQVDPTLQFDLSWDSQTPLQVLNTVTSITGAEWELERDEAYSRYLINVVDRIGSSAPVVRVREGLDVLQVDTQRTREKLYTAIRPQGDLETGGEERANIGLATWRVANVASDVVTLEAHGGGIGPVLEDGQHVGLYLEADDATWWEIVDSTAPDLLELESGGGASFAVGDDVMITADDQGTLLTELQSPSGIAAFGYVQGTVPRGEKGYRNWVRNPFVVNFDGTDIVPQRVRLRQQSGTQYQIVAAPSGFTWGTSDRILADNAIHNVTNSGSYPADMFIDVSGATQSFGGIGRDCVIFKNAVNRKPAQFDDVTIAAYLRTVGTNEGVAAGEANGAQDFSISATLRQVLNIDGLPAGLIVPVGTVIARVTFLGREALGVVGIAAVVNSSGQVSLQMLRFPAFPIADNEPLFVYLPPLLNNSVACASLTSSSQPGSFRPRLDPIFGFRVVPGINRLVVTATFASISQNSWASPNGPYIEVFVDSVLEGTSYAVDERGGTGLRYLSGKAQVVIEEIGNDDVEVRIRFPSNAVCTWLTGVQVALTREENPAIVEGSQATRLFQAGQLALAASRNWPATYTATVEELASAWDLPTDSPAFQLGAYIHLTSPNAGIDEILRVTEIQFDPLDPKVKTLVLDTDPERITQLTSKQRGRAIFVDVDIQVDNDGRGRETVLVSESPPVVVSGVNRFVVPSGVQPLTDVLDVEILE